MTEQKILIVGGGPIGHCLAIILAQQGIPVKIIDKIPSITQFTKALTINSASLKVLQGIGIVDSFLAKGKILTEGVAYFNERLTAHLNKKYLDSVHNYFLSIPQPLSEAILQEKLRTYAIQVEYQKELTQLVQHSTHVEAEIRNLNNNAVEHEQFAFVIGCDGAHSTVRRLINLTFTGHDYDMYFIVSDVNFEDNCTIKKSSYFIDDTGFIGTFLMDTGYTRLVIRKDGFLPKNKPEIKKEELQAYLDEHMIKKPLKIKEMVWASSAQIITRITESGRVGRVFIAGDAYHLFSPVGGHNMNTGFIDVMNLGWKLSYYLKGWAKENILDTYSEERSIAIQKLLEVTNLNTQIVMRRDKTSPKIDRYKPNLANRNYYRTEFPYEFAGYFADHSNNSSGLVGKHVPYIKFIKPYGGCRSTYDLPILQKLVLFYIDDQAQENLLQELSTYQNILQCFRISDKDKNVFIKKLNLIGNQTTCMIRPDGFVGLLGTMHDAQSLLRKDYYY